MLVDRIRFARATEPERARGRGRRANGSTVDEVACTPARNSNYDESLDLVVSVFQIDRRLTMTAITEATGLESSAVKKALEILVEGGQVRLDGRARSAAYVWTV